MSSLTSGARKSRDLTRLATVDGSSASYQQKHAQMDDLGQKTCSNQVGSMTSSSRLHIGLPCLSFDEDGVWRRRARSADQDLPHSVRSCEVKFSDSTSESSTRPTRESALSLESEMSAPAAQVPADFENLLKTADLRAPFQEFVEQQFCAENLNFWMSVENYRAAPIDERVKLGRCLYNKHFSSSCTEPINIDSLTMHCIMEAAERNDFKLELFDKAQYQIFHLMKYDVWPRFQRSEFFSRTVTRSFSPVSSHEDKQSKTSSWKPVLPWKGRLPSVMQRRKKEPEPVSPRKTTSPVESAVISGSGARKRHGWSRNKQASMPTEVYHGVDSSSSPTEVSRPSRLADRPDVVPASDHGSTPDSGSAGRKVTTASAPVVGSAAFLSPFNCTVILPDGQRRTVALNENETIQHWLQHLADIYGFDGGTVQIVSNDGQTVVDDVLTDSSSTLADRTWKLTCLVKFFLDIPCSDRDGRRILAVKARSNDETGDVLKQILPAYNLDSEHFVVCVKETSDKLPKSTPITRAHNKKLVLLSQDEVEAWASFDRSGDWPSAKSCPYCSDASIASQGPDYHELASGIFVAELAVQESRRRESTVSQPTDSSMVNSTVPTERRGSGMLKFVRKHSGPDSRISFRKTSDSGMRRMSSEPAPATWSSSIDQFKTHQSAHSLPPRVVMAPTTNGTHDRKEDPISPDASYADDASASIAAHRCVVKVGPDPKGTDQSPSTNQQTKTDTNFSDVNPMNVSVISIEDRTTDHSEVKISNLAKRMPGLSMASLCSTSLEGSTQKALIYVRTATLEDNQQKQIFTGDNDVALTVDYV